ncbi:MAG: hypothetical protein AUG49_18985 [Catenulispora sp. 13_1_20CM_3_70_7]|nr:MAG: hypothetical protein AUG49_18985 [Catenulispora sp. 13_1_20CM_3_70_7]
MSAATLIGSGPVIGLIAAVGAMWIRLTELYRGPRPRPVVDEHTCALAVARIEHLAGSPDPADQAAAYRTVIAVMGWLRRDLADSHDPSHRIARASALERWELAAEQLRQTPSPAQH